MSLFQSYLDVFDTEKLSRCCLDVFDTFFLEGWGWGSSSVCFWAFVLREIAMVCQFYFFLRCSQITEDQDEETVSSASGETSALFSGWLANGGVVQVGTLCILHCFFVCPRQITHRILMGMIIFCIWCEWQKKGLDWDFGIPVSKCFLTLVVTVG